MSGQRPNQWFHEKCKTFLGSQDDGNKGFIHCFLLLHENGVKKEERNIQLFVYNKRGSRKTLEVKIDEQDKSLGWIFSSYAV